MRQRFKMGDRVRYVENPYHSEIGEIRGHKQKISAKKEKWSYLVWGIGFESNQWIPDKLLQSAQPCPNCKELGWDWVSGCDKCGRSPEDLQ